MIHIYFFPFQLFCYITSEYPAQLAQGNVCLLSDLKYWGIKLGCTVLLLRKVDGMYEHWDF